MIKVGHAGIANSTAQSDHDYGFLGSGYLVFKQVLRCFLRDLCANMAIVEFCNFQAFSVSVT